MHPSFIKFCIGVLGMGIDTIITEISVKARNRANLEMYDSAIEHAKKMDQAVKDGDLSEEFSLNLLNGKKPVDAAVAAMNGPAPAPAADISESPHAGTSQLSAAGRACIPCGNDHFSTVSGLLAEAMRFARTSGIADPEVVKRISLAEDELNAFERVDAAPDKIAALPGEERDIISAMTQDSREIRHRLSDLKSPDDLLQLAADVKKMREEYRMQVFGLQLAHI